MREGRHVRVVGLRFVVAHGASVRVDARLDLGGASGMRLLEVSARGEAPAIAPLGALRFEASFRGETSMGPDVVTSGPLEVVVRVAALGSPIVVTGRLLVDEARAYVDGGEARAEYGAVRFSGSIARDGAALRARGSGELGLDALARELGAALRVRDADALSLSFEASGSAAEPLVTLRADAPSLGVRAWQPRWMPPMLLEDVCTRAEIGKGGFVARASARVGEGRVAAAVLADGAVHLDVRGCPLRWLVGLAPLATFAAADRARAAPLLDDASLSADVVVAAGRARGTASVHVGASVLRVEALSLDLAASDARGTETTAELDLADVLRRAAAAGLVPRGVSAEGVARIEARVAEIDAVALRVSGAGSVSLDGSRGRLLVVPVAAFDAELTVRRSADGLDVALARAVAEAFGGGVRASGGATLGAAPRGAFAVNVLGAGPELLVVLAALGPSSGPLVARASHGPRARGEAWIPGAASIDASVAIDVAAGTTATVRVVAEETDLHASLAIARFASLELDLAGRLAMGHAVDLGLFDGGALPARQGVIDVALSAIGPPEDVRLSGAFHADALVFAPAIVLEDVHALLSVRRGVAVWNDVRARLAGGLLSLAAVVDRDGALAGMRGWLRVDGVEVGQLAAQRAEGVLSAELALEQHGPDTAPVLGEGSLVVADGAAAEVLRSLPTWLPASVALRNARARGPVTARIALEAAGVRLFDVAVPLADGHVDGSVRVGFDGTLEAHAEVHLRGLVTVPLRVRGAPSSGAAALDVDVDVDVLATALAGVAAARARVSAHPHAPAPDGPRPVVRHAALTAALSATDWAAVARRARRPPG